MSTRSPWAGLIAGGGDGGMDARPWRPDEATASEILAALALDGRRTLLVRMDDSDASISSVASRALASRTAFLDLAELGGRTRCLVVEIATTVEDDVAAFFATLFARRLGEGLLPAQALEAAADEWRSLLSRGSLPTDAELIGFWGELALLEVAADAGLSNLAAAWQGPAGGVHDFVFAGGLRVEVKTSERLHTSIVHIGSIDQLDAPAGERLYLTAFAVSRAMDGRSVLGFADDIAARHPSLRAPIETAMHSVLGGRAGAEARDDLRLRSAEVRAWHVDGAFPRLVRSDLAVLRAGVQQIAYAIDLSAFPPATADVAALGKLLKDAP